MQDAVSCALGGGKTTERHAEGRSDYTIDQSLVQPCSYGPNKGWDTQHFCVDYRALNAVTRADTFLLPHIDDLLDQLGNSRFFTTLDLASGYWQIRPYPSSREKTAFSVPQGLFEFRVMPFGLTNAPAVFQRLMERVLAGLNPEQLSLVPRTMVCMAF